MLHRQPLRLLSPALRAAAAALFLWGGAAAWAAAPAFDSDEDAIAAVQAAYAQAVTPGEQANLHGELLATVLQRIKRSHATQVDLPALEKLIAPDLGPYFVVTAAISVENTHNFAGGTVQTRDNLSGLRALADARGLRVHLDGARAIALAHITARSVRPGWRRRGAHGGTPRRRSR